MNKTLRYSMICVLMAVCGLIQAQTTVTFDFDNDYATLFPNLKGVSSGTGDSYVADGEFKEDGVATVGGVVLTIEASAADANTPNRVWASSPRLRMYNGKMTVAAPSGNKITAIDITLASTASKAKWDDGNTVNVGSYTKDGTTVTWGGAAAETVEFTIAKNTQMTKMVVTLDGDVTTPETPDEPKPIVDVFNETFESGMGQFTINDVTLGEGLSYVWKHDSSYKCMKASAFANSKNHASESWLISPVIELSVAEVVRYLVFEQCVSKHFGNVAEEATLWIREQGGEWKQMEITYPEIVDGKSFSSFEVQSLSLAGYEGKKIEVGFKYTSTENASGTWEIKNVCVTTDVPTGVDAITTKAAPADNAIYNMAGQRLDKPQKGINIRNGKKFVVK